ncbi:metal-response element-binding transcription factor 2 isoform X1 [Octopus bimaculoides]|uniref:PHD-type domain-containing protein n=1 Tax=Octopus bimaculoides TaxID=37653 RepID=A0A0L8FMJ4_OCTBM|nr:metal-response element-binding transcription factor 2 isoform X1 [Octopus bimaculoides]XP_014788526.1 metal-response element-binding transcription factor 2 isoform X1 [Octopus bimaculoides]XP_014788527.1 metal-response element-binding transcription factor 2 isoform X1 [Octopus bimaculoides]XP_052827463.1 metal-response element-binding transcription factor 2 isoform X1 [Octopus bimaculoides]|eukprot:XP_014788525.1 PREDICTED: metal-response element-binding transcription factor 2-like isoform X1 [Octopus bimaculoides]
MASNGCCYLDGCSDAANEEFNSNSDGLNVSLSPVASSTNMSSDGTTVSVTKQLCNGETSLDKKIHDTDGDMDMEYHFKAITNNYTNNIDNNTPVSSAVITPSTSDTDTITNSSMSSGSSSPVNFKSNDDSNNNKNSNNKRKLMFSVGQDVLARWNDGLFYLGNILKVDDKACKCFIRFEDDSEFLVMFKDIQRGAKEGEIMCCSCLGESSDAPDEIVLCDNCGLGYHQLCHNPAIDTQVLNPEVEWLCRLCVFATTVKRGGALKSGPNAQALQMMKQSLPYNLNELTWDAQHKTNLEQSYCYCGGPGIWYIKMLQCCRCRMWFHEACIQCLDQPLLYGDRFYMFVCSFCNSGPEYLKRIPLKWIDVAQLALFNLYIVHQKKYYDLDKVIMPWVYMNWQNLQLDSLGTHLRSEEKEKMLETLRSHKKRFQCGREIKKSRSLWALRLRLPPTPPAIDFPINGQITDDVMNNLQMKRRKTKMNASKSQNSIVSSSTDSIRIDKSPVYNSSLRSTGLNSFERASRAVMKSSELPADICHSPLQLKRKTSSDLDELLLKRKKTVVNGNKESYRRRNNIKRCTLDTIIPPLSNFDGINHPFRTDLEQKMEKERLKLKEKILNFYQSDFDQEKIEELTKELEAFSQQKQPLKQKGRRKMNSLKCKPSPPASSRNRGNSVYTANDDSLSKNNLKQMSSSVSDYISVVNKFAKKETFHVLARRFIQQGQVQYLIQWDGVLS